MKRILALLLVALMAVSMLSAFPASASCSRMEISGVPVSAKQSGNDISIIKVRQTA